MPTSRWKFTEFRLPSRLWIVLKKLNLWMCEICENPSMLVKKKHPRTISLRVIIFAAHEESGIFCRGGLSIFSMRDPPTSDVDPWPEYFLLRTLGNSVFLSWISLVCERRKENYLLYGIEKWSSRSILRLSECIRALKNETAVFKLDNFHDQYRIKTESATINNPVNYRDVYNNVLFFLSKIGLHWFHLGNLRNVTRSDAICLVNVG